MAANIGEIRAGVSARIKDTDARLSTSPDMTCDVDRAILSALEQYGKDRPLEKAARVAGTGAFKYLASGLTGFVDGFSAIVAVAYPHLTTDQLLAGLEDDQFQLRRDETGLYLWFTTAIPAATEHFLVAFTAPHTLNASTSTVPASDDQALMDLGAAFACDLLAQLYAKDIDTSITADSVDRRTKSDNYRSMAASWRKAYAAKMQTGESGRAAGALVEIDRGFGNATGTDYFFHGRRRF